MEITKYISNMDEGMDLSCVFAICNYVPDEKAKEVIRKKFENLYIFYPAGAYDYEAVKE